MIFVAILSLKNMPFVASNYLFSNIFLLSISGHIVFITSFIRNLSDLEIGFLKVVSKFFFISSREFPFIARAHNKADVSICFVSFLCTFTSNPEIMLLFFEADISSQNIKLNKSKKIINFLL